MATVLYFLLASVISGNAAGLHSDPSGFAVSKEYTEIGMQQATSALETCPVSGTMEVCLSASRITSSRETFYVHVCPSDGSNCNPLELCYISSVPKYFIQDIYSSLAKCNSTSHLLVAGQAVTVSFYEMDIGDTKPQDCFVIFGSDGRPNKDIKACDGSCDFDPIKIPVSTPPPTPPPTPATTKPTQPTQPAFCRDNCRQFRPPPIGGCFTCHRGFTNPPRCCDPAAVVVANSASQPSNQRCNFNTENGVCKKGFLEPDCCQCEDGLTLRSGQCHQTKYQHQGNLKEELLTAVENVLAKFQT